jgi:hypothetical protein
MSWAGASEERIGSDSIQRQPHFRAVHFWIVPHPNGSLRDGAISEPLSHMASTFGAVDSDGIPSPSRRLAHSPISEAFAGTLEHSAIPEPCLSRAPFGSIKSRLLRALRSEVVPFSGHPVRCDSARCGRSGPFPGRPLPSETAAFRLGVPSEDVMDILRRCGAVPSETTPFLAEQWNHKGRPPL